MSKLYTKNVNKSIASTHRQKNNGYSAFTEYPLSRLPTPSDRCHNRNFSNYFLMSTRPNVGGIFCVIRFSLFTIHYSFDRVFVMKKE